MFVTYKHAANKGDAVFIANQIFGFTYNESGRCWMVIGPGNALFPIAEDLDTAKRLLLEATNNSNKESIENAKRQQQ